MRKRSSWPTPAALNDRVLDRALGAFVGVAIGDALGSTLEFMPTDPLRYHSEIIGGGPFGVRPGEWTDDTAMALALADTLLSPRGFTPAGFMTRLADWFQHGRFACQGHCIDIGHATLASVQRFIDVGIATCPDDDPANAGNGSLVRLAPIALRYLHDPAEATRIARLQSTCTHSAPAAADACTLLVRLLQGHILGQPDLALASAIHEIADADIMAIARGSYLELRQLLPTGHVVRTLETAMWAFSHAEDFEAALIASTGLGGDADSIGAVTGMLAGATYGLSAIPERWLLRLSWNEEIIGTGEALLALASATRSSLP